MKPAPPETQTSDAQSGFTLVEIMVVVLIIGILVAVAAPTFFDARSRAEDRSVQGNLKIVETSVAHTVWEGKIASITTKELNSQAVVPNVLFRGGSAQSHDSSEISVNAADTMFVAASRSASGQCFFIRIHPDGTASRGTKDTRYCSANNTNNVTADGW